jgi:hypothetical protein
MITIDRDLAAEMDEAVATLGEDMPEYKMRRETDARRMVKAQ